MLFFFGGGEQEIDDKRKHLNMAQFLNTRISECS